MTAEHAAVSLNCEIDQGFAEWMAACGGSLAITTYQADRLLLVGWNGRQVSFLPRAFERVMGIDVRGGQMALATRHALLLLANAEALAPAYLQTDRYDALYLPHASFHMPDLRIHDLAYAGDTLWMVNTLMSCLCKPSPTQTFVPAWRPPFVDVLAPEDRCHLNGLAVVDERPRYVTALGATNAAGAWRERLRDGGVLLDVDSGETLLGGLAMPHSPRWHHDALWLLNSGEGQLLRVDASGRSDVVCELPAYLRGLCFVGDYALVGLCMIRERAFFADMPVAQRHGELMCGIAIVDLRSGRRLGLLRFTSGCTEIYDLRFLEGIRRPAVLNLERAELKRAVTLSDEGWWLDEALANSGQTAAP